MPTQFNMIAEVRSFMKNRVILTAAELDLFTKLDQNSISAKDLAAVLDLDERATTRILDCRSNMPLPSGAIGTILQQP
jgi:hypothetical protein